MVVANPQAMEAATPMQMVAMSGLTYCMVSYTPSPAYTLPPGLLMYMLMFGLPAAGGGEAMLVMLGTLGTAWGAVVSFYFGSSADSEKKSEMIFNSTPNK